jgi:hypothetical protein
MTADERSDLYLEWRITPTKNKALIREQYKKQFKEGMSREHWEEYLVGALNLRAIWSKGDAS